MTTMTTTVLVIYMQHAHMHLPHTHTHTWDSVAGIAMGWTVQESNPGGGEISCTHPDQPRGPASHL